MIVESKLKHELKLKNDQIERGNKIYKENTFVPS